MKAKSKPLAEIDPATFGVPLEPRVKVLKTEEPGARKAGRKVSSVSELVTVLRNEAGIF